MPPRRRKSAKDVLRAALYTLGLRASLPSSYAQLQPEAAAALLSSNGTQD